ncbi:hypothetical protein ACWFRF_09715 [Nocardia sp. NPDC055165]|uniref:hypothetical protein n=1 Tax=Nocardia sp. NPDC060220 TaxID=3347076 RepID=UPI00365B81C8
MEAIDNALIEAPDVVISFAQFSIERLVMHRRMIRVLVATAAVAGIAAGAPTALAAPAQPTVVAESGSAGTGSAAIDIPLGFLKLILCGPWASTEPHPNPTCR